MAYITGLFDNYDEAADAVRALEEAGISSDNISLISNNTDGRYAGDALKGDDGAVTGAETGAGLGAVAGGGAGLLTGLGLLSIPGVGPVVAGGWLTATLVGLVGGATARRYRRARRRSAGLQRGRSPGQRSGRGSLRRNPARESRSHSGRLGPRRYRPETRRLSGGRLGELQCVGRALHG